MTLVSSWLKVIDVGVTVIDPSLPTFNTGRTVAKDGTAAITMRPKPDLNTLNRAKAFIRSS
jgi:hypothetical protein